jgi:hypothetical protein
MGRLREAAKGGATCLKHAIELAVEDTHCRAAGLRVSAHDPYRQGRRGARGADSQGAKASAGSR